VIGPPGHLIFARFDGGVTRKAAKTGPTGTKMHPPGCLPAPADRAAGPRCAGAPHRVSGLLSVSRFHPCPLTPPCFPMLPCLADIAHPHCSGPISPDDPCLWSHMVSPGLIHRSPGPVRPPLWIGDRLDSGPQLEPLVGPAGNRLLGGDQRSNTAIIDLGCRGCHVQRQF